LTACCLVALVLLPFTAPFRTCDIAAFFGGAPAQHVPWNRPGSAALTTDSYVASVPAISRAGRLRLIELAGATGSPAASVRPVAALPRSAVVSQHVRERAVLATILRL